MVRIDRCPTGENITCKKLARRDPLWNAEGVCGTNWSRYVCYNPKTVGTHGVPIVPFKVSPIAYTGSPAGKKKAPPKDDGLPWYAWLGIALGVGGAGYGIYRSGKAAIGWWRNRPPKGPDAPGGSDSPDAPDGTGYQSIEDAAIDGVDMQAVFTRLAHEQMEGDTPESSMNLAVDELFIALEADEEIKPEKAGEAIAGFKDVDAFREFLVGEKGAGGMGMADDDPNVAYLAMLWQMNTAHKSTSDMNWENLNDASDLMFTYAANFGGSLPRISDDADQGLLELVDHQLEHGHEALHEMAMLAHLGQYAAKKGAGEYAESMSGAMNGVRQGAYSDIAEYLAGDVPSEVDGDAATTLRAAIASTLMMRAYNAADTDEERAGYSKNAFEAAQTAMEGIGRLSLPADNRFRTYVNGVASRAKGAYSPPVAAPKPATGLGKFKIGR